VASEAVPSDYHREVTLDGHLMGDACLTGLPNVRKPASERPGSLDDPLAIIPFLADGRTVGVASVFRLLPQKSDWADVDLELFKLLGAQAGAALIAANLYQRVSSPTEALRGIPSAVEAGNE
jgi:GAF domain-containing protein